MRFLSLLILIVGATVSGATPTVAADTDRDLFYVGEARILDLFTGFVQTQKIILKKSMLPSKGMFTEIACVQTAGKPSEVSPVYMRVTNNSFEISDSPQFDNSGKLSGVGELVGQAWYWSNLKFHMTYKDGDRQAKIEDVNFVVGSRLIGRKQLYLPDGRGFQLYELEMEQIDQAGFASRAQQMQCPSMPK